MTALIYYNDILIIKYDMHFSQIKSEYFIISVHYFCGMKILVLIRKNKDYVYRSIDTTLLQETFVMSIWSNFKINCHLNLWTSLKYTSHYDYIKQTKTMRTFYWIHRASVYFRLWEVSGNGDIIPCTKSQWGGLQCFLRCTYEQTIVLEQTLKLLVFRDDMTLMRRHWIGRSWQ